MAAPTPIPSDTPAPDVTQTEGATKGQSSLQTSLSQYTDLKLSKMSELYTKAPELAKEFEKMIAIKICAQMKRWHDAHRRRIKEMENQ